MSDTTLVFPDTLVESARYALSPTNSGERVIGAAAHDPEDPSVFSRHYTLPYIYDELFLPELLNLLRTERVSRIYCPHRVAWNFLREHLTSLAPSVVLLQEVWYKKSAQPDNDWGYLDLVRGISHSPRRSLLGREALQAIFCYSQNIAGQSRMVKLAAFAALALDVPKGDIVEIGSFFGRSAFVLGWLARRYQIGSVLCVDPWDRAAARQTVPQTMQQAFDQVDYAQAFEGFVANLLPCFWGTLNYLRMPSQQARSDYREGFTITSSEFGDTTFTGCAALVHVDGNHDYESVRQDVVDWADTLLPGGWLVIDDYEWPFGDGPKRVGNAFLEEPLFLMERSFVVGDALFIQRGQE